MNEDLRRHDYLWKEADWVLVRSCCDEAETAPFTIYNKTTSEVLMMTDEQLFARLCSELKRRGCEILDEIPKREVSLDDLRIEN